MKNKAHVIIISVIAFIPSDIINEPKNTNDKTCDAIVAEPMLKLVKSQNRISVISREKETYYFIGWIQSIQFCFFDHILYVVIKIKIFYAFFCMFSLFLVYASKSNV